jgi:putative SOS response-associated peptidase YedK
MKGIMDLLEIFQCQDHHPPDAVHLVLILTLQAAAITAATHARMFVFLTLDA